MNITTWCVKALAVVFKANRLVLESLVSKAMFREYVNLVYSLLKEYASDDALSNGIVILNEQGGTISLNEMIARCKITLVYAIQKDSLFHNNAISWGVPKKCIRILLRDCIDWQNEHYEVRV